MKKEIILKGKEFILRPYKEDDFISLVKNANNKKIAKNYDFPSPFKKKDIDDWMGKVLGDNGKNGKTSFVIDIDGFAVGGIGGSFDVKNNFIFSLGYWIGELYWNKGIVSEAVKVYTSYLFKNFKKIKRLEAFTFSWNKGSQRVLEKNSFKFEGVLRKSFLKNGKIVDKYMFSKLKNDR